MPVRITLIAVAVALVLALAWMNFSLQADLERLEREVRTMDTYLKQFALPIEDLRRDIGAIYLELEQFEAPTGASGVDRQTAAAPQQPLRRAEPPAAMPLPLPSVPMGPVYYGNYDSYDTGVAKESMQRRSFGGAVDEEEH